MQLDVTLEAADPIDDVVVGLAIHSTMGWLIYGTNTDSTASTSARSTGAANRLVPLQRRARSSTGRTPSPSGVHTKGGLVYDSWEQLRRFEVAAPGRDIGLVRLPVDIRVDPTAAQQRS